MDLHVKQVHLHFHPQPNLASALLSALSNRADPASETPADTTAASALTPPKIGEVWPGQGGIYLGIARGQDGGPDQHKIMAEATSHDASHADVHAWAKKLEVDGHKDFHVATRQEGLLICANAKDKVDTSRYHWLSEQYSSNDACVQDFNDGGQDDRYFTAERPARAVRSFDI